MRRLISRKEASEKIDHFFKQIEFSREEMKKIKRLAMKYKIQLGEHRKLFCKGCLSQLKGEVRISAKHKTIECQICGFKNKQRMKNIQPRA
jgi:RNase P subunit RPR2